MSGEFQLVIFDCDGVLVDSDRISVRIDVDVLGRLGWPMSESEVVERFVGLSEASMTREIERQLGRRLPEGWEREYEHLYREAFERELRPVDGVVEALDRISTLTCVASGGTRERIRFTLGLTGLYERFRDRIFSSAEVKRGKPAPDLFLCAAESMGVSPDSSAVVEDSVFGVEAARAAGMRAFAYSGGLTCAHRLEGLDTSVFDDMRKLPGLLGEGGTGRPGSG